MRQLAILSYIHGDVQSINVHINANIIIVI